MPYTVFSGDRTISVNDLAEAKDKYQYKYPEGLDLRPQSQLHQRLVTKLLQHGLESSRISSNRFATWNDMDEKLTAYIPTSEKEKRVQAKDRRKPVSIVFPYSYAILETLVSYLVAAFFPDPIFRYEGVAPEDIGGAMLMQNVIALQASRNKVALNLHTMFRDASAYGFGVVSPQWSVKMGKKIIKTPNTFYGPDGREVTVGNTRSVEDTILFEGNSLINIDPYCYLPDPNVPIHDVQRGEYVGWVDRTNLLDLLLEEEISDGELFNVKYLRHMNQKSSSVLGTRLDERNSQRGRQYDSRNDRQISDPVDQLHLYVKLVPKQWNLGNSETPEKWLFTLAGDSVIIRAQPLGLLHNMFPVCVCAPDFDGYSPIAYSRLEILSGMQTTIDWLFNSHIANVRKAINDVLIVDPYLININDLADPEPGGLVRLRRPAWGKGVKDAVMQLNVVDITRQNIGDVSAIIQYMQTIGGTDNTVMGSLREGGPDRLSAKEFQGTAQGAVNRLERVAKIIGLQAMQDIGYMFAYHAQQLMSKDVYVRTVGEWPQVISDNFQVNQGRVLVEPDDILVDYDLLVRDGSIPGGNFNDSWIQLFQTIGNNEQLLQQFDVVRVFEHIATQLGAKNVQDFRRQRPVQPVTAPDETVQSQVQQGNLVPVESF